MRSIFKVLVLMFSVIFASAIFTEQASAQQSDVSFQVFYDQLSPYGQWVNYPNYGFVWIPDAGPDFVPYSSQGHWILTDYGWTWMSDYSWGWAPFHYGRWDYDQYYGWLWIPGNEWGPAWVTWRRADGYYGWEPMEPGITLSATFGRAYDSHNDHWIFVRDRDIDRSDIGHYYIGRTDQSRIIMRSSVIRNTYSDNSRHTTYAAGPTRNDFQKVAGRRVSPVSIRENDRPGQNMSNGHLMMYRPVVVKSNARESKPAPSRVINLKDVKQPSEKNVTNRPVNTDSKNNIRSEKQPGTASPRNNSNNNTKAFQKPAPSQNMKTGSQPANLRNQQTMNQDKNTRGKTANPTVNPNTSRPVNTTRAQNNVRVQQPNNVRPANTAPTQNMKRVAQPNNIKTQKSNTTQNVRNGPQPNNIKSTKTNPSQKNVKEKQSSTSKSSGKDKTDSRKNNNNAEDIKKNE
jgi:Family of unknown function (DUF6600)